MDQFINCRVGDAFLKMLPHCVPCVGTAHVILKWIGPTNQNLTPAEMRAVAMCCTLAASAAEAAEHRERRKTARRHGSETSPA
jgi:hypothetical protein